MHRRLPYGIRTFNVRNPSLYGGLPDGPDAPRTTGSIFPGLPGGRGKRLADPAGDSHRRQAHPDETYVGTVRVDPVEDFQEERVELFVVVVGVPDEADPQAVLARDEGYAGFHEPAVFRLAELGEEVPFRDVFGLSGRRIIDVVGPVGVEGSDLRKDPDYASLVDVPADAEKLGGLEGAMRFHGVRG